MGILLPNNLQYCDLVCDIGQGVLQKTCNN